MPVFTDPKIVLKMSVVGNADLCVFWMRELEGRKLHEDIEIYNQDCNCYNVKYYDYIHLGANLIP